MFPAKYKSQDMRPASFSNGVKLTIVLIFAGKIMGLFEIVIIRYILKGLNDNKESPENYVFDFASCIIKKQQFAPYRDFVWFCLDLLQTDNS